MIHQLVSSFYVMLFLTFIISGLTKILDLKSFVNHVIEYNVIPTPVARIYGILLPFIEISASLMLVLKDFRIYGIGTILCLLISFLIAIRKALNDKRPLKCSCFGKFFASEVDLFAKIKVVFLIAFTVILACYNVIFEVNLVVTNIKSITIGIFLMLLYLSFQMVWDQYKKNVSKLKLQEG